MSVYLTILEYNILFPSCKFNNIVGGFFCLFVCFCFLGPHLQHTEIPRLGSNQSHSCQPIPRPRPYGIRATSSTYATAQGRVGSLTHWARPGFKPASSWILVGFFNRWAIMGTPTILLLNSLFGNDLQVSLFFFLLHMKKSCLQRGSSSP